MTQRQLPPASVPLVRGDQITPEWLRALRALLKVAVGTDDIAQAASELAKAAEEACKAQAALIEQNATNVASNSSAITSLQSDVDLALATVLQGSVFTSVNPGALSVANFNASTGIWEGEDNAPAIQTALDNAVSPNGARPILVLPPGYYGISHLSVPGRTRIIGHGLHQTRLVALTDRPAGSLQAMLTFENGSQWEVHDLSLDGNSNDVDASLIVCPDRNAWGGIVKRVGFFNSTQHAIHSSNLTSENLSANHMIVERCMVHGGSLGYFNLEAAPHVSILRNILQWGGVSTGLPYAIRLAGGPGASSPWNALTAEVKHNWFEFDSSGSVSQSNPPRYGSSLQVGDPSISKIIECILLDGAGGASITQNRMSVEASDNLFDQHIRLTNISRNNRIAYNKFRNRGERGIDIYIEDNNSYGNTFDRNVGSDSQQNYNALFRDDSTSNNSNDLIPLPHEQYATGTADPPVGQQFRRGAFIENRAAKNLDTIGWYVSGTTTSNDTRIVSHFPVWATATTYSAGDCIVNANHGYLCETAGGGASTIGPTHSSGRSTEIDGYTWLRLSHRAEFWPDSNLHT